MSVSAEAQHYSDIVRLQYKLILHRRKRYYDKTKKIGRNKKIMNLNPARHLKVTATKNTTPVLDGCGSGSLDDADDDDDDDKSRHHTSNRL